MSILKLIILMIYSFFSSHNSYAASIDNNYFLKKYGTPIYEGVNKSINTSLVLEFLNNYKLDVVEQFSVIFKNSRYPLLDTGQHYKIDLNVNNELFYPIPNKVLVNYEFQFSFNTNYEKIKFLKDSILLYGSIISTGREIYKNRVLYYTGLIAYDTTTDHVSYICGTSLIDKIENEYFDHDSTEAGFMNFIKIKYFNYSPKIEKIDYDELYCIFFSEVTKKRYYCRVTKRVEYNKQEELYHKWIVDFGELEE